MNHLKILIVDDDEVTLQLLKEVLEKEGFHAELAGSGEAAIHLFRKKLHPIIISDIRMLEMSGVQLLREVKKLQPQTSVILMTGFGSLEGTIEAIQEGAFDYVSKPFRMEELKAIVTRASKHWESLRETRWAQPVNSLSVSTKGIIGKSPKIVEVYKLLARAAMSSSTVLIYGESGTGKELVAQAIHNNSQRRLKRFIAVNCGALAENLLESELFGHVRGAFTGAIADKRGLFEESNGGTLFLDEIGDVTPSLQVKLLRVLQENEIKPVGSSDSKKINVRVIAATHRDLEALVKAGKFRDDLYYRLKVISIGLPPLRERMEDLDELVGVFIARYAEKNKKQVSHISDDAMELLKRHSWPGNIRELEHTIERAVAMTNTNILFTEDFPNDLLKLSLSENSSLPKNTSENGTSLEDLEKSHIVKVLNEVQFNKSKASELLGIDRATLYRKAQRYGIDLRGK